MHFLIGLFVFMASVGCLIAWGVTLYELYQQTRDEGECAVPSGS